MAHTYNVDTGAWVQDPTDGWVSSKVISKNVDGDKATLVFEITSGSREGEVRCCFPGPESKYLPADSACSVCRK
jgi:hypothetical protein